MLSAQYSLFFKWKSRHVYNCSITAFSLLTVCKLLVALSENVFIPSRYVGSLYLRLGLIQAFLMDWYGLSKARFWILCLFVLGTPAVKISSLRSIKALDHFLMHSILSKCEQVLLVKLHLNSIYFVHVGVSPIPSEPLCYIRPIITLISPEILYYNTLQNIIQNMFGDPQRKAMLERMFVNV